MTKYLLSLFACLSSTMAADLTVPPQFKFEAKIGELPSLLLGDKFSAKHPPLSFSSSGWESGPGGILRPPAEGVLEARRAMNSRGDSTKRYYSRMPILSPEPNVGKDMPVKLPDPAIDYKLLVKEPDVESRK